MKSTTKVIVLCLSFYFFSISVTAQNLDLSNLGLTQVPDSVWSKKDIVSLNLSGNNIRFISNKIDSLQALQSINLKDNPIQKLPEEFFSSKIHIINVSNTPLYDDPEFYNSIKQNRSANAYLFTGIRGVGKTTIARIVAKSLNCLNGIENFCKDGTYGFAEFKAYIADDKVAGVAIQISNGTGNEESKKQLLYKYVVNKFGMIENSDKPNWTGYKIWEVGGKEVYYHKILDAGKFMIEELQVTNSKFRDYVILEKKRVKEKSPNLFSSIKISLSESKRSSK